MTYPDLAPTAADVMDMKNAELGERIRRARKMLGLTQQHFADQLGVTQPTVHRWEKGFYDPDERALQRLAALTQLSPAYFRYGDSDGTGHAARTVPLLGRIGAGAQIRLFDDRRAEGQQADRPVDKVEAPIAATGIVALQVEGDSLYPVYQDSDVIFYVRDPALPEPADGPMLLRRVMRDALRGRYTLVSHHAPPMNGVKLDWASPVRWVHRA
jgi:transcriptional regulator with XRE-family HTH domain